ncbi:MAG: DUF4398 domain-containing protein [Halobaculum sp.]
MTTTSWNHSSRLYAVLAVCALLVAAVAPAVAVSVGETDAPDSAAVGSEVSLTVTLTNLYQDPSLEEWELAGQTQLENPTWTVVFYDQTGSKVGQESFGGQEFSSGVTISASEGISEVEVQLTGTVPDVGEYSYDPQQTVTGMRLEQVPPGGGANEITTVEVAYYTEASKSARQELDAAAAAIEEAGNPKAASDKFDQAVQAYESGEFELAKTLANEAQKQAEQAQSTAQRNQLILMGGGVLLVLGLVAGGFFYWRSQQETTDRLG